MHCLSCHLAQDNHDHPLTIQKDWGGHLPCWMNPLKFLRRGWARVLQLFSLHFWLWVKEVNPCLILGYNWLYKIAWIIFIVRQEIPRNIEPPESFSDHWSTFTVPILPKLLAYLRCRLGLIYCPQTYAHFASFASQVSPPITHNQGVHDLDIFISGGIFGAARPSIILNTLSPPLKLWSTW